LVRLPSINYLPDVQRHSDRRASPMMAASIANRLLEGNLSYSGPVSGAHNNATARSSLKKNRTVMQQPSA
jgi:hypothetical protein